MPYKPASISQLLERLRPFDLAKGEVVMILNLRPASVAALNTIIEDMSERFSEEQQEAIVVAIAEVLGEFPAPAADEAQAEGDVSMNDGAASADV